MADAAVPHDRAVVRRWRVGLGMASALAIAVSLLLVGTVSMKAPGLDLASSWSRAAESGALARLATVAAIETIVAAAAAAVGVAWIGLSARRAQLFRRVSIAVFTLSGVFLLMNLFLPWAATVNAHDADASDPIPVVTFLPPSLVLVLWLVSGVGIAIRGIVAAAALEVDHRRLSADVPRAE